MVDVLTVEFELDEKCHSALCCEADRLGITASEVARRALAAWLGEIADDSPCAQAEPATADA